jgi:hypothetical protein
LTIRARQTPVDIAFGLNGDVYVTQYEVHRVAVFRAADGQFQRNFPAEPPAVAAVASSASAAAASSSSSSQSQSPSLSSSASASALASSAAAAAAASGECVLANPYGIVVDGEGNVLIGDYANKRVAMFRPDGAFVRSINGAPIARDANGVAVPAVPAAGPYVPSAQSKLEGPQGLALDDEGRLWITDITTGKVVIFK